MKGFKYCFMLIVLDYKDSLLPNPKKMITFTAIKN